MTVALVAGFMTLLDVSIVNVALPSIRADLGLSAGGLQWVLSGYALTFGLLLVPAGRFGDARGRRDVFIAGLAVFTLASAAAGMATGALWLIIARLVQGAAAGVVNPQVSGLVQQLFEPRERGRPFGLLGATIGVSTAVGPLLGGLLIQLLGAEQGWRWIFFINVPIGIAAIVLGRMWIPGRSPEDRERESLDPAGVALLGAGVLLVLLPLVQEREWHGPAKWLLLVAGLVVLAGFQAWERCFARRGGTPVIELGLFGLRSYGLGALIGFFYFAGFTTIFFIYTLYLQSGLHYSALAAGVAITPFAIGSAVAAAVGGRVVNRYGRPLVATGLAMVAAGLIATVVALHFVPGHHAGWAAAFPLLVAGLGSGLVISPNQTLTLAQVPVRRAGSAGAVLQTGQRIGTALGIAVVGAVFFNRLATNGGSWSLSFRTALLVTIGFVLVALAAALADVLAARRADATHTPDPEPAGVA
ncbi:MFS transporter [Actinoplanes sp. NPDC049316]|uniref:MFS transporter n=1 Tax=Actinoplanes sp. NPDC049316 TaxID=3154727 RepID=UPI003444FAEC